MFIRRILNCLLAASIAASVMAAPVDVKEDNLAPLNVPQGEAKVVDGSYIVVYKPNADQNGAISDQAIKAGLKHVYDIEDFKGFSGKFDADTLKKIRADPAVAYVERDSILTINVDEDDGAPWGANAPWGLARISHRKKLTNSTLDKYVYNPNAGKGVTAYVIDTGIFVKHPDFEGRARVGKTFTEDGDEDGQGHGTHVAGTIGSKTYGVAKKVKLVAVKVLNNSGSGTVSDIIAGIDWVVKDAKKGKNKKAVANMSLGGGASDVLDEAVNKAADAGIHFAVAAGNYNIDACKLSPSRASKAISTAASDVEDKKASFSDWGKCVDIIAPGVGVLSTSNDGKSKVLSGTSMATPHVAGVIAQFLSEKVRSPADMLKYLQKVSIKDAVTGFDKETVNYLLYNNLGA
ncbi:uncharacterized protein VTP21DRAFT_10370 [Calcarisporiella thermophila]|uniref:uncharacterized protein n=1 Tax=Calcarisporiella thermophila TaxID=911321 RepID=UPI003743F863